MIKLRTFREIAQAVGHSENIVFRHFETRREVFAKRNTAYGCGYCVEWYEAHNDPARDYRINHEELDKCQWFFEHEENEPHGARKFFATNDATEVKPEQRDAFAEKILHAIAGSHKKSVSGLFTSGDFSAGGHAVCVGMAAAFLIANEKEKAEEKK